MRKKTIDTAKKKFRIPIALHIYSSLILISLITVFVIGAMSMFIIRNYIATECERRIISAAASCQEFSNAFNARPIDDVDSDYKHELSDREVRDNLLNTIVSSSDFSSEASLALFNSKSMNGDFNLLWPEKFHSVSTYNNTSDLLSFIIKENSIVTDGVTRSIVYNNDNYYYRFIGFTEQNENSDIDHYEHYYLLIYINSSTYYSFANALNDAILRAIFISIIASAVISLIVAFPLYASTKKLSKFAGRIGKGDFTPLNGHIVSRELSDLNDGMNIMASKLEKSDIEQKTFFQNASHELRTPLMSIQGYAEGIKYGVFDENSRNEAVDIIISETTRLSNLVENLLSISKMDMSKHNAYEVKKQILDAVEIVEIVIDKVRGGFLHNGKELINDINIDDIYIYGNENDIFRMLENIFSNCLRYAKTKVTFKASSIENNLVFEIYDDGPGISEQVLEHIFDRFAKGSDGKHGIGLALAKSIAEEHNGHIEAKNIPDGGAHFKITLPIIDQEKQLTLINNEK